MLLKKIKRFYPLHIFMTVLATAFFFTGNEIEPVPFVSLKFVLNLFFIQEWFPFNTRSVNGVSWFLCVLFLFYYIFPWIISEMKKIIL